MAATISACTSTSSIARAAALQKPSAVRPSSILGLPSMRKNMGKVRCAVEGKPEDGESKLGMAASLASCAAAAVSSPAAMALVDERMSTEGTGLPFGLSNNLLGWILLGVFALIWALYFVYTSSLEEDEDSGMSL
ncbi:Photosystem II reaction center W protein, chloroplastic [Sesamum alatum]|uniref:PSII 6.1 kDa protein n=1 Tax=Sesamum alatum TaxID=300844 RepID=A0AAE2D0S6_9LAMI|nr:Photosystem II reaction center W protein, chloroplastic [Sesamum alatum]